MADEHVDPTRFKIFPRNLTARADYIVRGNPTNSRPESGVDNCFPGLEFDQRNLDQQFFPGLHFEFQRADGAVLTDIRLDARGLARGLSVSDLTARPLYLWFLYGRTRVDDPEPALFEAMIEGWCRQHAARLEGNAGVKLAGAEIACDLAACGSLSGIRPAIN